MSAVKKIAYILVIIGGLNWLLVGINPNYDLVAMIGGGMEGMVAKVVYILVGLSAILMIFGGKSCKKCEASHGGGDMGGGNAMGGGQPTV